jgi:Nif-specific ferredoxin III
MDEDGAFIAIEDDEEEFEKKVMVLAHPEYCVGCEACSRVCPKKCYTHGPMPASGMTTGMMRG